MNKNILEFYFKVIDLKNVIRTGWQEVGIDNPESVMDHIGGTILLASEIATEKNLNLDMQKVYEMVAVKELKKLNGERSVISGGENTFDPNDMLNPHLKSIYDEYMNGESEEAKFALMVSKLEEDIQAKKYELDGKFTIENAKKDIENYPEDIKSKLTNITKASDGWLTYNRKHYNEDFKELSLEIEKM